MIHGYNTYANGCRCAVCRKAKAEYMRTKRLLASVERHNADGTYIAPGITHGLTGYQDSGCRCDTCYDAKRADDLDRRQRAS